MPEEPSIAGALLPSLSADKPPRLSAQDAGQRVHELALQIAAWHQMGRWYGKIGVQASAASAVKEMRLPESGEMVRLGVSADEWDRLPVELQRLLPVELPSDTAAARRMLQNASIALEPCQIDVHALGTLLCRLLTGESVAAYLRSPRVKRQVREEIRPILERALGCGSQPRYSDAGEFAYALHAARSEARTGELETASRSAVDFSDAARPGAASDTDPIFLSSPDQPNDTSAGPAGAPGCRAPSADLPYARLGQYELIRKIGHGGMGDVYLGYERALERQVAIKVLPADLARSDEFVRRFRIEATAVARLTHPNIVPIHFIGEDEGHHFYVMQFIEGESLAELLGRTGALPVEETLAIVEQVLAGLAVAHRQGMVHRDIKPGNILLDRPGRRALLADFGLVKSLDSSVTGKTATGVIMGTAEYISPEQGRGLPVDARSDLYSMGVLLYRMLSGRLPFTADSPTALIFQHVYEQPLSLRAAAPEVSAALAGVVARLMAKSPDSRYQSVEEVLADLRVLREGQSLPDHVERTSAKDGLAPVSSPDGEFRKTTIITAPEIDEASSLPAGVFEIRRFGWWERTCDRALSLFRKHAPEAIQQLQNTSQQVDAAVAARVRRQRELARLAVEAQSVLDELHRAAQAQREAAEHARQRAAAASDPNSTHQAQGDELAIVQLVKTLEHQATDQREQLDCIQIQLARVTAALHQLQNQRDILNARLKVAGGGGVGRRRAFPGRHVAGFAAALVVLLVVGRTVWYGQFRSPGSRDPEGRSLSASVPSDLVDPQPASHSASSVASAGSAWDQIPLSSEEPILILDGHHGGVHSVAFHPFDRLLVSGSGDSTAIVWNLDTGRPVQTFRNHVNGVPAVAISPDGAWLATGSGSAGDGESTLKLWSTADWTPVTTARGQTHLIRRLEFAGSISLAALHVDGLRTELRLWDGVTGDETETIDAPGVHPTTFAVHPLGTELVFGGDDGLIRVWDAQRREELRAFRGRHQGPVGALAYNAADGTRVASLGRNNGELKVWDATTGGLLDEIVLPIRRGIVALSPDGRRIAIGYEDRLTLGDAFPLRLQKAFPMQSIGCVAFSPDGVSLAAGGAGPRGAPNEAQLVVWNARLPPADMLLDLLKRNSGDLSRALADARPGGIQSRDVTPAFSLTRLGFDDRFTVTDEGLRELAGLTRLEALFLSKMPVTDTGLKHLIGLTRLRELSLADTEISDAAGADLSSLTGLEMLNLSRTAVGDRTVEHLKMLPFLRDLDLAGTRISDLALEQIAAMTGMKKLSISRTKTTAAAVEKLRKALPGCDVKR